MYDQGTGGAFRIKLMRLHSLTLKRSNQAKTDLDNSLNETETDTIVTKMAETLKLPYMFQYLSSKTSMKNFPQLSPPFPLPPPPPRLSPQIPNFEPKNCPVPPSNYCITIL